MAQGTKEIHFEEHIDSYLTSQGGYHSISPKEYNKELCVIPSEIIAFVRNTQPEEYKVLEEQYGTNVANQIVQNVANNLNKNKTL